MPWRQTCKQCNRDPLCYCCGAGPAVVSERSSLFDIPLAQSWQDTSLRPVWALRSICVGLALYTPEAKLSCVLQRTYVLPFLWLMSYCMTRSLQLVFVWFAAQSPQPMSTLPCHLCSCLLGLNSGSDINLCNPQHCFMYFHWHFLC